MTTPTKTPRVRFAPSPTGFLHVGGLRTALYNYLFAKQQNGEFLLRIEDTDQERFVAEAEDDIIKVLKTFGMDWDEQPIRQSERLSTYRQHADNLIDKNLAYRDYHTPEELTNLKKQIGESGLINRKVLSMPEEEVARRQQADKPYTIRFAIPENGATIFSDLIRGEVKIENNTLEDFIILKSDGYPTYNFANVIDDHHLNITHVIRGEEFIPSTPKHILLYQALEWEVPQFAHLPLLLNKSRAKLSKREGDVAVTEFLNKGYLKEALLNFVALLGWHPSQSEKEIYDLKELLADFKLENVQKAGAIFDLEKLNWFQHQWSIKINEQNRGEVIAHPLYEKVKSHLSEIYQEKGTEQILALAWPHIIERVVSPEEIETTIKDLNYLFEEPEYEAKILIWKKSDQQKTLKALNETKEVLRRLNKEDWQNPETLEQNIKKYIEQSEFDNGSVLWPLRVALSGKARSLPPFDILHILWQTQGQTEIEKRIETALGKLS